MADSSASALALAPPRPVDMPPNPHDQIWRLYQQHRASVARHLLALVGQPDVVDDLVNETFVRAFTALDRFDQRSKISTWLHGIALNVARNHRSKWRRRSELGEAYASQQPTVDSRTPEHHAARAEALDAIERALAQLSPELREVFVLRSIEEHSLKDVAAMLSMPVSTVHARARRAEQEIQAWLIQEQK